jgi:tRNA threonylcarbamoyladenosine biosynthesis protein TsaE
MRNYRVPQNTKYHIPYTNFFHVDLYRLEKNVWEEVRNLGIEDIWSEPKNVVVIEWAEKIKDVLPKSTKWIKFENLGGDRRKISIMANV